jgi:hypothetical protein
MDRRLAIKQLAILTGGVVMMPSCDFSDKSILQAYENLKITEAQKQLIARVTNTIFPGIQLKSAKEIQLEDFVLVMANDCLEASQQSDYVKGLGQFDGFSKKHFGKPFSDMDQNEATDAFRKTMEMDSGSGLKEAKHFLATTKRFALQGYLNSEYFMTEIRPYELVPARFIGSKRIDSTESIDING